MAPFTYLRLMFVLFAAKRSVFFSCNYAKMCVVIMKINEVCNLIDQIIFDFSFKSCSSALLFRRFCHVKARMYACYYGLFCLLYSVGVMPHTFLNARTKLL